MEKWIILKSLQPIEFKFTIAALSVIAVCHPKSSMLIVFDSLNEATEYLEDNFLAGRCVKLPVYNQKIGGDINAKKFLETKGVYGLDSKKRMEEVLTWMEEYADLSSKRKNVNEYLTGEIYTESDVKKAYRYGEVKQTFLLKDKTVILPSNYEGVDG